MAICKNGFDEDSGYCNHCGTQHVYVKDELIDEYTW